jgi:hypothetical protein
MDFSKSKDIQTRFFNDVAGFGNAVADTLQLGGKSGFGKTTGQRIWQLKFRLAL